MISQLVTQMLTGGKFIFVTGGGLSKLMMFVMLENKLQVLMESGEDVTLWAKHGGINNSVCCSEKLFACVHRNIFLLPNPTALEL